MKWQAGKYTLTVDRFESKDLIQYKRGDEVQLDEADSIRLGQAGAIAEVGSVRARIARGETPAEAIPASLPPDKVDQEIDRLKRQAEEAEGSLALLREMREEEAKEGAGGGEG